MLFLCSPYPMQDIYGIWAILLILMFVYPSFVSKFLDISNNLLKEGKIREDIVKIIKNEYKWLWGILGILFLASAMCLIAFPLFVMLLAFTVYFLSNFIFYFLNKKDYKPYERNLLLSILWNSCFFYYNFRLIL
jgi:heme/copper-type cytochrome/quinol oxidase subunit 2